MKSETGMEDRSFLCLCSYYRQFIKPFANIAKTLHVLTERTKDFIWTQQCQDAFNQLMDRLTQASVLTYPDPKGDFILDTDASGTGIGAVLSQGNNRKSDRIL